MMQAGSSNEVRLKPAPPKLKPNKLELLAVSFYHQMNDLNFFKKQPYAITITPIGHQVCTDATLRRASKYVGNQTVIFIEEFEVTNHLHGIIWLTNQHIKKGAYKGFNYPGLPNLAPPWINVKLKNLSYLRGWLSYMYKDAPKRHILFLNSKQTIVNRHPKKIMKALEINNNLVRFLKKI